MKCQPQLSLAGNHLGGSASSLACLEHPATPPPTASKTPLPCSSPSVSSQPASRQRHSAFPWARQAVFPDKTLVAGRFRPYSGALLLFAPGLVFQYPQAWIGAPEWAYLGPPSHHPALVGGPCFPA